MMSFMPTYLQGIIQLCASSNVLVCKVLLVLINIKL